MINDEIDRMIAGMQGMAFDRVSASLQTELGWRGLRVETISDGTITTMEYDPKRIRVWYNPDTNLVSGVTQG